MTTYTDEQLKHALAKMLPDILELKFIRNTAIGTNSNEGYWVIWWKGKATAVLDTELLHLCSLVEETLSRSEEEEYYLAIEWNYRASWQPRTIAAAMVKGVEIV